MAHHPVSAYLAYKQDTTYFVSWLGATAKAYGWKPPKTRQTPKTPAAQTAGTPTHPRQGPRPKGKDRKETKARAAIEAAIEASSGNSPLPSKPFAKCSITTDQLVQQMDLIVAKSKSDDRPTPTMPPAVHKALRRAIFAREKFAAWYQKARHGDDPAQDGHNYFIQQLRKGLDLLAPLKSAPEAPSCVSDVPSTDKADNVFMANMFAVLDVQDISDDEVDLALLDKETKQMPTVEFELQETEADVDLAIFSLFGDIHGIRIETKDIIRRLLAGEIGLLQATLSIAAALELVRQADQEVRTLIETIGYANSEEIFDEGSYPAYFRRIYTSETLGRSDETRSKLRLTPFDEFVMLPLGYSLEAIQWFAKTETEEPRTERRYTPFPLPPLRIFQEYIDMPDSEVLNQHRVRKGEADDQFIKQIYHDMIMLEHLKDGQLDSIIAPTGMALPSGADKLKPRILSSTLPYHDVLHNALRPIWKEGLISMQSVFAAQTLIDIHDLCDSHMPGTQRQVQMAKPYGERLDFIHDPSGGEGVWMRDVAKFHSRESWQLGARLHGLITKQLTLKPDWTTVKEATLLGVPELKERWVRDFHDPRYEEMDRQHLPANWEPPKSDYLSDPWAANITGIWPNDSPTFLMDTNPLYGGTALLDLLSSYELLSVAVANESMAILCMAHIYHAARHLGLLQSEWVELEKVIGLQTVAIFANDLPTTPKAMFERFKYRIGLGLSKGQAAKRSMAAVHKAADAPWKLKPSPAATMISQTLDAQVPLPRLLYWLENEASRSGGAHTRSDGRNNQQATPALSSGPAALGQVSTKYHADNGVLADDVIATGANNSGRQTSLRQSLHRIEGQLATAIPNVDYLSLTRACEYQLARIHQKIQAKLGAGMYTFAGPKYTAGHLSGIEMTMGILHENMVQAELACEEARLRKKRKDGHEDDAGKVDPIGSQLKYAARVLGKMLGAKG